MIEVTRHAHWIELGLNRPSHMNAINADMYHRLARELTAADSEPSLTAVILRGHGPHFTAGNDLSEFKNFDADAPLAAVEFLKSLVNVDIPLLAAIQGNVVGVGVTMLQHCDFVYAKSDALLSMPFTKLGVCPEAGASLAFAQIVGDKNAARWLLDSEPFTAEQALEAGLLTAISDPFTLPVELARDRVQSLALKPSAALRATKRLMRSHQRAALLKAIDDEVQLFKQRLQSPETQLIVQGYLRHKRM
ncbi:enoyl-CoA hydratase-related protein [Paenalcaligenes niemegkensis]|uniref:enoyl-CoA hydratase-related protein n=1 Tax=Paenalcaligenes niemegkensis TaxID=2895469 RepID=UPI001EE882D7|nr:enoyl-CoA hydratase-related protein [Paenalcaligenes niemegkensis]MCQ9617520.1 enoyl-CoA hydratase-related protein [Paenalcaligenes niemegkensis]